MHPTLSSITIDKKFIQQLNKRLELIHNYTKSITDNSSLTHKLIHETRSDLHQRYELRNNYYHRKFPLLLHDLCSIKSTKKHCRLIEKQHFHSLQFYKKIFNIQSFTDIEQYHQQFEQSNKCLNELKNIVKQYENDIDQLKEKISEQNKQISLYSNNLFQIQFEQNQLQSDIQQLKQHILFEKQLYNERKQPFLSDPKLTLKIHNQNLQKITSEKAQTLKDVNNDLLTQLHKEYENLSTQITEIKFHIKQKSIDLLPLRSELHVYRTILSMNDMNFTTSKDQSSLVLKANTEEIHHQSTPVINKLNKSMMQPKQRQLPIESISKSRKSKVEYDVIFIFFNIRTGNELSVQLIESVLPL